MADQIIYTVGGTVQAGGGIYIPRKADDELLGYCRASEFAFILSSRQVGKSSLMVRTARQLESENIGSVIIDLSGIGVKISADQWYLGILNVIAKKLKLKTDIFTWWSEGAGLGPAQQMTNFFSDVLLKEVSQPVVLFFDEIDSTLSIPFADDFFAALRAVYNARSTTPEFKRLSFVMIGVATPSDLIADDKRTPFNIGHRVDLTDFTPEEAQPLAGNLGKDVLGWIFHWTGGHPYLTQSLCAHLSKATEEITETSVAEAVTQLFSGERGRQDNNLQFVRDMLTKRAPDIQRVLKTYKDIRSGKKVTDDERSIPKAHLKISGVVRREDGRLQPRNRIYERAFDLAWVKENTPSTTTRKLAIALSFVTVIALIFAGFFAWQEWNRTDLQRAAEFQANFITAGDAETRLKNLAGLFALQDETFHNQARVFFRGLTFDERKQLFAPVSAWGVDDDQLIVVKGIYQSMTNNEEDNVLLKAMQAVAQDKEPLLADEIGYWRKGREELNRKNYEAAEISLTQARDLNMKNPALYYDRAQAYIGQGRDYYSDSLDDLQEMVALDKNRGSVAYALIRSNASLSVFWEDNKDKKKYEELVKAIIIPMVEIPAGEFTMGSTPEQVDQALTACLNAGLNCDQNTFADETPPHQVNLKAYAIDQYEVTNARYAECVAAGVCNVPASTASFTHDPYYGNAEFNNYPMINVSWFDANTYCEWRGARLPSEAEWEKAARGTDARVYPWGNDFDCKKGNFDDETQADSYVVPGGENCDGFPETSLIGSFTSGQSPYDVYDMAGNVWEWTADWYDVYPGGDKTASADFGQTYRVLRGGSWDNYVSSARSAVRSRVDPTDSDYFVGFRCARSLP